VNQDLIRLIDSIARDKNVDKELLFQDIEAALLSAARKFYGEVDDVTCVIDRMTGEIQVRKALQLIDYREFGRIAAQTAKQVLIQKIRDNERASVFEEFVEQKGMIVTGAVTRVEGNKLIVTMGRAEALLPKSEQIPGETHNAGDRIRCLLLDVRDEGNAVKLVLSRSHPDFIKRLFEVEVPEVQEKVIEIRALAREAGYRTKIAVSSIDTKVDAVGACVGMRGSRIKNIVDELGGEKIDIVRWNESSQILITNALKPAEVVDIVLNFELNRATIVVNEDQLSLAIGKRGQNVRLAARLTGWDLDILTPAEHKKALEDMERVFKSIPGVEDTVLDRIVAMGLINLMDIEEVGVEPLVKELGMAPEVAAQVHKLASEEAARIQVEDEARKAQADIQRRAQQASGVPAPSDAPAPIRSPFAGIKSDVTSDTPRLSPFAGIDAAKDDE